MGSLKITWIYVWSCLGSTQSKDYLDRKTASKLQQSDEK